MSIHVNVTSWIYIRFVRFSLVIKLKFNNKCPETRKFIYNIHSTTTNEMCLVLIVGVQCGVIATPTPHSRVIALINNIVAILRLYEKKK